MIFPWHTASVLEAAASPKKQLLQLTRSSILITLLASSAAAFFLFKSFMTSPPLCSLSVGEEDVHSPEQRGAHQEGTPKGGL